MLRHYYTLAVGVSVYCLDMHWFGFFHGDNMFFVLF